MHRISNVRKWSVLLTDDLGDRRVPVMCGQWCMQMGRKETSSNWKEKSPEPEQSLGGASADAPVREVGSENG